MFSPLNKGNIFMNKCIISMDYPNKFESITYDILLFFNILNNDCLNRIAI